MPGEDLSACRHWRKSLPIEDGIIGLYPALNAVVGLNPAAAAIWDALIDTADRERAARAYADAVPARREQAAEDVALCIDLWQRQGLTAQPSPSNRSDTPPNGVTGRETWALSRTVRLAGRPVGIGVEDRQLAAAIADLTVDFPVTNATPDVRLQAVGPEGGWRICLDGAFHRPAQDMVEARGIVVAEIIRLMSDTAWTAVLHASVLTRNGRTLLLTGRSGSGKSTLSAELVSRGWQLVAEDCGAFDSGMKATPMPFAFSFKSGAWSLLQPAFPGLASARTHRIGLRDVRYHSLPAEARATAPVRPDVILDIRFRPDLPPQDHATRRLSPIETMQLFFNDESYIDFAADTGDSFLSFATTTPAFALHYGSSGAAHAAVTDCLRHLPAE
ncbi:PqqD family peptide modification chaperone [Tropicimonas sediminicola]|uniref:Hpr(Ser) kinase/phosphatase n=1 Tax=Tropicimonas sediminicola TaxID=1031541 RepID=A0A239HX59_9RHOB|nr:PqqD family peptide modification chaperone [Tropicimonas sediminicola]SNS85970.1 hypothetical protein SAMN05421757_10481 [Tropicimonas sediminicola]